MKRRFKNCQPNDPFRSELAGYRWGMNRKRLLLLREQEMFPDPQSLFARANTHERTLDYHGQMIEFEGKNRSFCL
jgi:hypothetical protein